MASRRSVAKHPAELSGREKVLHVLALLPEDVTVPEVIEELQLLADVEHRLENPGRKLTLAEVRDRIDS
jgi:hypothetical protein